MTQTTHPHFYPIDISVIVPLLNEAESLPELYHRTEQALTSAGLSFEMIFVDDGSTDNSWSCICDLQSKHKNIRALRFGTNNGKSAALHCGFAHAEGRVVATMDADLQDFPEELPALYDMIVREDYDLVSGWKKKRYDPKLTKNLPSKLFNATARKISGIHNLHDFNCGIKAYKHEVVKSIELYNDMHRYIPILAKQAGFSKIGEKVVRHAPRQFGKSKYGISRFFNGFLDLITLSFLGRFERKPMHFFGFWGTIMFLVGFLALLVVLISKFTALVKGIPAPLVTDRVYFFIALGTMIMGIQFFTIGFLGELFAQYSPQRNTYKIVDKI